MLKILGNNGMEEFGLATPTPDQVLAHASVFTDMHSSLNITTYIRLIATYVTCHETFLFHTFMQQHGL